MSTAKAQGSPQVAGQSWNHTRGTLARTQWGHGERCRRILEAGLPSSTSSQSSPGLCLQSRDSLLWGLWWPLLPCGPWSCTTDSGSGKICALTPARSLSDIMIRMVAKSVLLPVSTPVFLLVSPVVYFDSILSQAIEWPS